MDKQKQPDLRPEGALKTMAVVPSAPLITTSNAPEFAATRQEPNVLRKSPSLAVPRHSPAISRRHSWTSSRDRRSRDPSPFKSTVMEDVEVKVLTSSHELADSTHSLLNNKRVLSTTRPGATFDLAYYLKNTRPPTTVAFAGPDSVQDDTRRVGRRKTRGRMFRKRRERPDLVTPTVTEDQKPSLFVPPEGVEQKITAGGNKYLQIVSHPDLIDLGHIFTQQRYGSPRTEHTEAISSDTLDTWISSIGARDQTGANHEVNSSNFDNMQAHESAESLPGSRPKASLSFVSEARSMLPSTQDGFSLSIVDGRTMRPYFNGASDPKEALCSNPPSDPTSSPRGIQIDDVATSESARTPPLDIGCLEPTNIEPVNHIPLQDRPEKLAERDKVERRVNDVLAGQGLRRPSRDEIVLTASDIANRDIYPAAAMQARRNRDAKVRSRKIRELQRASQPLNEPSRPNVLYHERTGPSNSDNDVFNMDAPDTKPHSSDGLLRFQQENCLTRTMEVAVQAPVPRGRPLRKPARLILRDRSLSQRRIVDRHEDSFVDNSLQSTPAKQHDDKSYAHSQHVPSIPTRDTPTATSCCTPGSYAKHHSTPLLGMPNLTPHAVTATASSAGGIRASVCSSSHTSTSKEARLEARLEAVERENRLLEAALMAVLKTSGTLNRCPCVLLNDRSHSQTRNPEHLSNLRPAALIPGSGSRATTPLPALPRSGDLRRVSEEGNKNVSKNIVDAGGSSASSTHTKRGSWDSNESSISALEVYLRTKIGA